jgi:hypothetical protein
VADPACAAEVAPAQESLPPGTVAEVGGFLGQRLKGNAEYLLKFDVDRFVKVVEERKYRDWFWIGEQPGKWLEAAILAAEQSGNAALRKKAEDVLERLVAAQEPSGYLGVTDPAVRTDRKPLRGMDTYELYFTFHALLTAHERWKSDEALTAAERLGDFLIEKIALGKAEFFPLPKETTIAGHPEHFGLEGALLAHPMARLGRLSGERKYLDWSQWVVGSIDRWTVCGTLSNLDKVADGKLRLHEIQPNVHAHTLHMNLLSLLELYQATGDKTLLRKVRGAWDEIIASRVYVTGGVSVGEVYRPEYDLPNTGNVVETCATMSWLLLNQRLLELSGEPAFADLIERVLWNHLPAAQTIDGDGWRYHTPLAGWKPEGCFTGPDCCGSSGPRILAILPAFLAARTPDGIVVNQYAPSALRLKLASGNEVALRMGTGYPVSDKVQIEVAPARAEQFTLRLRLPAWCEKPTLSVNNQPVADPLKPGEYAALSREWKPGDRVELVLPMEARWVAGTRGNDGLRCLTRGPLVFALDTVWCDAATRAALVGDAKGDPICGLAGLVLGSDDPSAGLRPVETPERALGPAYRVRIALADGKRALATMLPFANVGVWYRDEAEPVPRLAGPAGLVPAVQEAGRRTVGQADRGTGRRDAYAIWLPEASSGRFRAVDLRGAVNVHSNPGKGLFLSPAFAADVFPFPRYGAYALRGIPFEVIDPAQNNGKNLLILKGGPPKAIANGYPASVTIPVGFRCRALHVLGGVAGWAFPWSQDRRVAATVRIRYDDAPSQEFQLVSGEHLADYNTKADVPGSARVLDLGKSHLRLLRIRTSPRSKITQIEIATTGTIVAPVIAALTAELPEE